MRISALDEFGIRCLLQFARSPEASVLTARLIASRERIGEEHASKTLGLLRRGGLLGSVRGAHGGYRLTRPAKDITLWEIIEALDGSLLAGNFCERYSGSGRECVWLADCSLRAVWQAVDGDLKRRLSRIKLTELGRGELELTT